VVLTAEISRATKKDKGLTIAVGNGWPQQQVDRRAYLHNQILSSVDPVMCFALYSHDIVASARRWNDLPVNVTTAPSLLTFRKRLKLHLLWLSYPGHCLMVLLVVAACYLGHLKNFLTN